MGLTEKILSQKDKIEGERRQVTVMFCDMEGFTPMVEKLGSEKAYSVMNEVYEILIHKVHDYEGTVNEMTGDGIMALYGAPIALEDAPQRALRSALAIHSEIAHFNENRIGMDPIKMRIGVHTGPVVVGTLGNDLRVEFKAVGDTVNLASRMEGLAEPGTTLVSEETLNLTEGLFNFEAMGEKAIRGKETAVSVYKLVSAKKDVSRPRLGLERRIYSDMVGRDKELNRIELQVLKAINGEGSIVNIIGEAGIGKSRLVAELKNHEMMKQVYLFEGRAISTGRNLSFHPIIDFLKQWARIGEDDSGEVAIRKLEIAIRRVIPEEINEVLPFVATLMGMKLSGGHKERIKGIEGEALEKLILKNLRDLMIKATELKPHVIVMEDLHWADTSSLELLVSLFRLAETQNIVFINVFRPGYEETGDRIVETIKERFPLYCIEINLQPLDEYNSEALIKNILKIKGLKHAVVDQIIKRADGNPFFIEEVVRSFIDQGAVVQKDGAFEVTENIDKVIIPKSINDVLMARIDHLEDKTRDLVKTASVIGRYFFYRVLSEVSQTGDDIDDKLSYLKDIQLIRERKRMDELEYLFKHALAQEAAYESILHQTRVSLHIKVANSIENVFKERLHEFYGMLANHYIRGENEGKAAEYLIKAGEEALKSSASSEALNYYQEGLKLYIQKYKDYADPEKILTFEKNIALAFFNKGQYEHALKHFDIVSEQWGDTPPKNKVGLYLKLAYNLLLLIIKLYFPSKKIKKKPDERSNEIFDLCYKKAISLVHLDPERCFFEFLTTLKRLSEFDVTKIENGFGIWLSASGLFSWAGIFLKLSKKVLDRSIYIINEEDNKHTLYYDFFMLLYNFVSGNWCDVKEYSKGLVDLNLRIGEFWHISNYILFHGFINVDQGMFKEAGRKINALNEIWQNYGNEYARHCEYSLKIKLLIKSRKLYEAQIEADAGLLFMSKTGKQFDILYYHGVKVLIQILQNNMDKASELLTQAKRLFSNKSNIPPYYISSYLLSDFLFDIYLLEESINSNDQLNISGYKKRAFQSGTRALKHSKRYAPDRTEVFRIIGVYYWLNDDQIKALKWWKKSIQEGERLRNNVELARSYVEIGNRLVEKKSRFEDLNGIKANEYLSKAKAIFKEIEFN